MERITIAVKSKLVVEEVEGVEVSYTAACSVRDSNSASGKINHIF